MKKYEAPECGVRCPSPCGKMRFTNRRAAKTARRRMQGNGMTRGSHLNVYRCPFEGQFFHIGSLPTPVVAGDLARADIRRPA